MESDKCISHPCSKLLSLNLTALPKQLRLTRLEAQHGTVIETKMQQSQDAEQTRKRNATNQLTTPCKNKQKGLVFFPSQCLLTAQTMVKSQVEQLTELGHISTSMDNGRRSGHLDANDTT
jgi:hypothetical protein